MSKRLRDYEDSDEFDPCDNYKFHVHKLTPPEKQLIQTLFPLNNDPESGWGWGTFNNEFHRHFEKEINGPSYQDIYALTNYTDAFFRFLYYLAKNDENSATRELLNKITTPAAQLESTNYTINTRNRIQQFLNKFFEAGNNKTIFNAFLKEHQHKIYPHIQHYIGDERKPSPISYIFAMLIKVMSVIKHLTNGEFKEATHLFNEMKECYRKLKKGGKPSRKKTHRKKKRTSLKRKKTRRTKKRTSLKRKRTRRTKKRMSRKRISRKKKRTISKKKR